MSRVIWINFLDSCVELSKALLFYVGIPFVCYGQDKVIEVKFRYEGREVNVDEIELFLVFYSERGKEVIRPEMVGGKFVLPQVCVGKEVYVGVKYKKRYMYTPSFSLSNQRMTWTIGFDRKPYNEEYYMYDVEKRRETKAVMYWVISPYEEGCGIMAMIMIPNVRRFYRESKRLVR